MELTVDRVVSKAGVNGTVYASSEHTFATPVVVKALNTANSGKVPDVLPDQGVDRELAGYYSTVEAGFDLYGCICSVSIWPLDSAPIVNVSLELTVWRLSKGSLVFPSQSKA